MEAAVSANLTALHLAPGHDKVQKVTLIPRGQAKGLTWFQPGEDPSLISKQQIMARIVGALGGRAAEEVIFGEPEVTTGASGDLQQVQSSPSFTVVISTRMKLTFQGPRMQPVLLIAALYAPLTWTSQHSEL